MNHFLSYRSSHLKINFHHLHHRSFALLYKVDIVWDTNSTFQIHVVLQSLTNSFSSCIYNGCKLHFHINVASRAPADSVVRNTIIYAAVIFVYGVDLQNISTIYGVSVRQNHIIISSPRNGRRWKATGVALQLDGQSFDGDYSPRRIIKYDRWTSYLKLYFGSDL